MLAGISGNIMHTFTKINYGAYKNCGYFKKVQQSAKNCSCLEGHLSGQGRRWKFFSGENIKAYGP